MSSDSYSQPDIRPTKETLFDKFFLWYLRRRNKALFVVQGCTLIFNDQCCISDNDTGIIRIRRLAGHNWFWAVNNTFQFDPQLEEGCIILVPQEARRKV